MISTFPPRKCGIGDYTFDLCKALENIGVNIDVLTYKNENVQVREKIGSLRINRTLSKNIKGWTLWNEIKKVSPNIIHLQGTTLMHKPLFNLFVLFKDKTPLVITVHDAPTSYRQIYLLPFLRKVYDKSNMIIVHSNTTKKNLIEFHRVEEEKIVKMHHGVDIERYNPYLSTDDVELEYGLTNCFKILFFGFLMPGKGIEILLEAFQTVVKSIPDARLIIAGGTPDIPDRYSFGLKSIKDYPDMMKKMCQSLGIEKNVTTAGYIKEQEVPHLLASADIMVFPYLATSQSGPMHKAMAIGCAIIATNVGGIPDVIEDGKNGYLIPPKNPQALADAIMELYYDKNLRILLGKNARKKAERELSWHEISKQTLRIYNEIK